MFEAISLLTFGVGILSGFIGGITGAGGGLIAAPYMMLIGISPNIAVSTTKLAGIGVGAGSLSKFLRSNIIDWTWVRRLLPITVLAAVTGSFLLLQMPQWLIKLLSVVFSIEIALQLLFDRKAGLTTRQTSPLQTKIGYVLFYFIDTLRSAIGSGIGTLNVAVMMSLFGLEAVPANAIKRFITFPALVINLIILIPNGLINWQHGIALLAGTALGGYAGAHIAIARGNLFVKRAFLVTVIILAISALLV